MSFQKPGRARPTTSRITVKAKTSPRPLSGVQASRSPPHSTQAGRGHQTHAPQAAHFCIRSSPPAAARQNGSLTGVISGGGFGISWTASAISALSQNGGPGAAGVFAVGDPAAAGGGPPPPPGDPARPAFAPGPP